MAWKWYEINTYKASVGGSGYYGGVQLFGEGFYALLKFHESGPLPDASAPKTFWPALLRPSGLSADG